jgi:hypothetical protein
MLDAATTAQVGLPLTGKSHRRGGQDFNFSCEKYPAPANRNRKRLPPDPGGSRPETSGTALDGYAIAWGITNRTLNGDSYLPVA